MQKLFSYGTLQKASVQRATFGRELKGQPDALSGFVLQHVEISEPDVLAASGEQFHPIALATDNPLDRVEGTVFEVSEAELAQADAYEVSDYRRVEVRLLSGQTAWFYKARQG